MDIGYKKNIIAQYLLSNLEAIVFLPLIFFGIWTIGCNLAVLLKIPYYTLFYLFFTSLIFSPIIYWFIENRVCQVHDNKLIYAGVISNSKLMPIIVGLSILFLFAAAISKQYLLSWSILVCISVFSYFKSKNIENSSKEYNCISDVAPSTTLFCLLIVCFVSISVTVFTIRQDLDDAYYLSMVVQAIDEPLLPVFYYEPMYGLTNKLMVMMRRTQSYELLVAIFSVITNLSHLTVYYIIFPIVSCITLVFTLFLICRRILISNIGALASVGAVVLILIIWGDAHRTYGNFAFVRFFQGKSLLIHLLIPLLVYLTWEFLCSSDYKYLVLCSIAAIGSIGVSVNAILLAPLTVSLVLFSGLIAYPRELLNYKTIVFAVLVCAYPLLIALIVKANPGGSSHIQHFGRELSDKLPGTERIIGIVLGNNGLNLRSSIVLSLFVLLPLLLPTSGLSKFIPIYVLISTFLILAPGYPFHFIFAKYASSNLIWRLSWIIPFPLFFGLSIGGFINSKRKSIILIVPTVLLLFAFAPEPITVSSKNRAYFATQNHKFSIKLYQKVERLRKELPCDGLIFAPENIAVIMASLRDYPPKAFVRSAYLRREKLTKRQDLGYLVKLVNRRSKNPDIDRFKNIIDKYRIDSIIFRRKGKLEKKIKLVLKDKGYNEIEWNKGYHVWIKHPVMQSYDTRYRNL